jgi:hypothetical protein
MRSKALPPVGIFCNDWAHQPCRPDVCALNQKIFTGQNGVDDFMPRVAGSGAATCCNSYIFYWRLSKRAREFFFSPLQTENNQTVWRKQLQSTPVKNFSSVITKYFSNFGQSRRGEIIYISWRPIIYRRPSNGVAFPIHWLNRRWIFFISIWSCKPMRSKALPPVGNFCNIINYLYSVDFLCWLKVKLCLG